MDLYLRSLVNTIFQMFCKLIYFNLNVWMTTLFVLLIQFYYRWYLFQRTRKVVFTNENDYFAVCPFEGNVTVSSHISVFLIFKNVLPLIENWHSFRYHKVESKPETIWFNMKWITAHGGIFRILLKTSEMEHFTKLVNG